MSGISRYQMEALQHAMERLSQARLNLPTALYNQNDSIGKAVNDFVGMSFVKRWKWFLFGRV